MQKTKIVVNFFLNKIKTWLKTERNKVIKQRYEKRKHNPTAKKEERNTQVEALGHRGIRT
jgi:hypothetical protein